MLRYVTGPDIAYLLKLHVYQGLRNIVEKGVEPPSSGIHGQYTHALTEALVIRTGSSQQDQSTFQQAALIGLNGL